tara:strand:+ start:916 stop:1638 length:723 start_codon:yes stop_codon:yes gene_type:complete
MISIDTVYQRVLAMANKEQRGYITPQEYNLLANQAQMQIFESYFFSKDRREKLNTATNKDDVSSETDLDELLDKKLRPFTTIETLSGGVLYPTTVGGNQVFQTGKIWFNNRVCRYVHPNEASRIISSIRHVAGGRDPFYTDSSMAGNDVVVYDASNGDALNTGVTVECIVRPTPVAWAYVVVQEKALYNSNLSTDFLLHISEEDTLVNTILELAGIVIKKTDITQIATQKNMTELQTQNQ